MLLTIPEVLSPEAAAALRERILAAEWVDGNATSGAGAASVKRNRQLPEVGAVTQAAQETVSAALMGNAAFLSAALPHSVFPPLFNRYGGGEEFGLHVDNAIRFHGPTGARIRTDLSATLFLTDPADYDGGELETDGVMRGRVIRELRGDGGFGYDVLFVADDTPDGRTSAELSVEEKDAISHRGKALRALAPLVAQALG